MKKFLFVLIPIFLLLTACQGDKTTSKATDKGFFSLDETTEAGQIVAEANQELREVKKIYKINQNKADELKEAIAAKDAEKVKAIAADLVLQINDGLTAGESALAKIEKAERMNINDTYKEYLRFKKDALRKQLDAFEQRRQIAKLFSEKFGGKDQKELDAAQAVLLEKENEFKKLIDEGRDLSQQGNDYYEQNATKK